MKFLFNLINNLRYLMRYNLKEIYKDTQYAKYALDFIKYEIKDDLDNLFIPKILSDEETIDYLIKNKFSISRFGDGEFTLINNGSIGFQKANKQLSERLTEILLSDDKNICIALPYGMCHTTSLSNDFGKYFARTFWGANINWIMKLLNKDKTYFSTGFTILPDSIDKYNHIRQIWENKDITIISGDRVFQKIEFNVFDNAKSIEYIDAPTINAFEKYDEILGQAVKISKDRLICIILGPTATVLAYDLAKLGYQALDLGHIVKSYDAFCQNAELTPNYLNKFFAKD